MLMRWDWDPFRELDRLTGRWWNGHSAVMPMDVVREDDAYVMHVDLPGIDPESIEVTVEKDVLTVSVERDWEHGDGARLVTGERPHGRFRRRLLLGEAVDTDRIEADYHQGVLTIRAPLAEAARPRRVAISTGRRKALKAKAA